MMEKEVKGSASSAQVNMASHFQPQRGKCGITTTPFIIANVALAGVATFGLWPNMVLYLMGSYNLHLATAAQILLLASATTIFIPIIGAFIADSYLGGFLVVGLGSIIIFLGMALLWLTAMIPQARPPPCNPATETCKSATTGQIAMLISSFALMAIGNGGLQCSLAFGADQVNMKNNPNSQRALDIFYCWHYAWSDISIYIAFTGIVYIQDHLGWKLGFGIPTALMFLSTFFFYFASPLYVKNKACGSLLTSFAQVIVAAYKNRKLHLPPKHSSGMYLRKKDSDLVVPTDKLRFLNKACLINDPEKDIAFDGSASNPWSLCTIDQVEELKAIIKVIPLWSTGILMPLNMGISFELLQAKSLNRRITKNFEVPAGSLLVIKLFTIFICRNILLASGRKGKPNRISAKSKMGLGLFFSFLHLVTAAIVEAVRRRRAISEGDIKNAHAVSNMSAMWLFPQLCLAGVAETFNLIGQNELCYTEFPKSMWSIIAWSLFRLERAAGNVVSSLLIIIVEEVTSRGGNDSWISDNINKGHYDKYYLVLATISAVNILYYLVCSWAYGPTADQESNAVSSPKSSVTSLSSNNNYLDFTYNKADDKNNQLPYDTCECNGTSTDGVCGKKIGGKPSSSQPPLEVRKEKLGDRITALHQLACPFGKTDTASVLLEVNGYIRFLQGQVEVLSSPHLDNGSRTMRNQQYAHGEKNSVFPEEPGQDAKEKPKDLRSRGLCLVPVSCTQHAVSEIWS